MVRDWQDLRYRGDRRDVEEMFSTYRVGDYLATFEENRRRHNAGLRQNLLQHGIRLTERISPRIYRIYGATCAALGLEATAEVFCLPDADVNAFAMLDLQESGEHDLIGVTSAALERLDDPELVAVLGHEIGHFLFENNRLNALLSTDEKNPSATVLPPFGESLFLRWRKKAEISADRVGLLACGDFHPTARALIKSTFGLSEKNLNLDVGALVAQIDELKGEPQLISQTFASHPLLPIRLKSLELFSRSEKARRHGATVAGEVLTDDALEDGVDELLRLTRRHPVEPLPVAVMQAVAHGGALVLAADKEISDAEVKMLVQVLHRFFTDDPEEVVVTDRDEVERRLDAAVAVIEKEGGEREKAFILSRLAEIALADGALMDAEATAVLKVAERMKVPANAAYSIVVGAAQAVGLGVDAKLAHVTQRLRRSMEVGFGVRARSLALKPVATAQP
jgi:uncharacterized tellurite resistance protein B-like protein